MFGIVFRFLRFIAWYGERPAKSTHAIRFGILGAAAIAPASLLWPSRHNADVTVVAIAARDITRARRYAYWFSIPKVAQSYTELLQLPELDAVYIPSPNGYHYTHALAALEAGKHVFCEKPLCANAREAELLEATAKRCDRLVFEACHSFYHPVLLRAREIVRSGELGTISAVGSTFRTVYHRASDIRFNVRGTQPWLAGGALMDTGVYAVHCVRFLLDARFASCTCARAKETFPGVDSDIRATVTFENSAAVGEIHAGLRKPFPEVFPSMFATVHGSKGSLLLSSFVMPHFYHSLTVSLKEGLSRTEKHYGSEGKSTYEYQLEAFVDCVRRFQPGDGGFAKGVTSSTLDDPINTLRMIDEIYTKAGLEPRHGVVPT